MDESTLRAEFRAAHPEGDHGQYCEWLERYVSGLLMAVRSAGEGRSALEDQIEAKDAALAAYEARLSELEQANRMARDTAEQATDPILIALQTPDPKALRAAIDAAGEANRAKTCHEAYRDTLHQPLPCVRPDIWEARRG